MLFEIEGAAIQKCANAEPLVQKRMPRPISTFSHSPCTRQISDPNPARGPSPSRLGQSTLNRMILIA